MMRWCEAQKVRRRSQNCWVGMRYEVSEEKGKSGAGRADGSSEGVMLPGGTWWRTRVPVGVG